MMNLRVPQKKKMNRNWHEGLERMLSSQVLNLTSSLRLQQLNRGESNNFHERLIIRLDSPL